MNPAQLIDKTLTGKWWPVRYLLMIGSYQLLYTCVPPHATMPETMEATVMLKRPQLKELVNARCAGRNGRKRHWRFLPNV